MNKCFHFLFHNLSPLTSTPSRQYDSETIFTCIRQCSRLTLLDSLFVKIAFLLLHRCTSTCPCSKFWNRTSTSGRITSPPLILLCKHIRPQCLHLSWIVWGHTSGIASHTQNVSHTDVICLLPCTQWSLVSWSVLTCLSSKRFSGWEFRP